MLKHVNKKPALYLVLLTLLVGAIYAISFNNNRMISHAAVPTTGEYSENVNGTTYWHYNLNGTQIKSAFVDLTRNQVIDPQTADINQVTNDRIVRYDSNGNLLYGMQRINNNWYAFKVGTYGNMQKNGFYFMSDRRIIVYTNNRGVVQTGSYKVGTSAIQPTTINGKDYYLNPSDGALLSTYNFDENAANTSKVNFIDTLNPNDAKITQHLQFDPNPAHSPAPTITTNISGAIIKHSISDIEAQESLTPTQWPDAGPSIKAGSKVQSDEQAVFIDKRNLNSDSTINVNYSRVGTYNGRDVGLKINISNIDTRQAAPQQYRLFGFFNNFYDGIIRDNAHREQYNMQFYYTDTKQTITFPAGAAADAYLTFQSLNGNWLSSQNPYTGNEYVAGMNQLKTVYITDDTETLPQADIYGELPGENVAIAGQSDIFNDYIGSTTFNRSAAMYELSGSTLSFTIGALNWRSWTALTTAPLANSKPDPPTKTVTDTSGNDLNNKTAISNQDVKYKISQPVGNLGTTILSGYNAFIYHDKLDSNMTYKSATLTDSKGNSYDLNTYGTLTNNNGDITYTVDTTKLGPSMYDGRSLILTITATANSTATSNFTAKNQADVNVDNNDQSTNTVTTNFNVPKLTVNYEDTSGNKLATSDTIYGSYNKAYTTSPKTINNYWLYSTPSNAKGTFSNTDPNYQYPDVTYVYKKNTHVTATYKAGNDSSKQESGQTLADPVTTTGRKGDAYTTENKTFTGWHLTSTPSNAKGTYSDSDITVSYVYDRDPEKVNVRYVDTKGNAVADPVTLNGYYGLGYSSSAKTIAGYHLTATPSNASGTYGTSNSDVVYVYDRDIESVTANYLAGNDSSKQESGQTLADPVTVKGYYHDPYVTVAKSITGWHLTATPSNALGIFQINNDPVNYIYDRNPAKVIVNYVDVNGKKLADSQTLNGYYGLSYVTTPKQIDNYHLTATPSNANGLYGTSDTTVNYVYDENPAINETITSSTDNTTQNNSTSTSLSGQYNMKYYYVDHITVGGSMTMDSLSINAFIPAGVNPIFNNQDVNHQGITVFDQTANKDVTSLGTLSYKTSANNNVPTVADANSEADVNLTRNITWVANSNPQQFVGHKLIFKYAARVRPNANVLKAYASQSGITPSRYTTLTESNNISTSSSVDKLGSSQSSKTLYSNSTNYSLPNIYTIKPYKAAFQTGNTVNGQIYFRLHADLVGKPDTNLNNASALSLVADGLNLTGSSNPLNVAIPNNLTTGQTSIMPVTVTTPSTPLSSGSKFNFTLTSNLNDSKISTPLLMTSSLINSQTQSGNDTIVNYNASPYSTSNSFAQFGKTNTANSADQLAVEKTNTYYNQNVTDPQQAVSSSEQQPYYLKLMEVSHGSYNATVSAKTGYGIKNDVSLFYYGRHLAQNVSNTAFEQSNLAMTFSTDKDLTAGSSQIKNPTSELLDYDATIDSNASLKTALSAMSTNDQTTYLTARLGKAAANKYSYTLDDHALDQAGTDLSSTSNLNSLAASGMNKFITTADSATQTDSAPQLYTMNYKFNQRTLTDDGTEYYNTTASHYLANQSVLGNSQAPSGHTVDGGNLFYTRQWLPLGNYTTHYNSGTYGTNNMKFSLTRVIDFYGHRYLPKTDSDDDGDKYDDIAIQPIISNNQNSIGQQTTDSQINNWLK